MANGLPCTAGDSGSSPGGRAVGDQDPGCCGAPEPEHRNSRPCSAVEIPPDSTVESEGCYSGLMWLNK